MATVAVDNDNVVCPPLSAAFHASCSFSFLEEACHAFNEV